MKLTDPCPSSPRAVAIYLSRESCLLKLDALVKALSLSALQRNSQFHGLSWLSSARASMF